MYNSCFHGSSSSVISRLALSAVASVLPLDSRNPSCPLPVQMPCGGGGGSAITFDAITRAPTHGNAYLVSFIIILPITDTRVEKSGSREAAPARIRTGVDASLLARCLGPHDDDKKALRARRVLQHVAVLAVPACAP